MILISVGVVGGVLFWLKNLLEDVQAQVTGIWINSDSTFKVLIYNTDFALQGDVIWANSQHQKILGLAVLKNMKLNFFIFGKGSYICPFTHQKYDFRLRLLSKKSMQLYFTDPSGKMISQETWSLTV